MTFDKFYASKELVKNPETLYQDGIFFLFSGSFWVEVTETGMFYTQVGSSEIMTETLFASALWLWEAFAKEECN